MNGNQVSVTPIEEYQSPTVAPGLAMKTAIKCAKLVRYWDGPSANAATDAGEMNFIDKVYWWYKLARPIVKAEKGVSEALRACDKSVVKLPEGFTRETSMTVSAAGDIMPANELESSRDLLYESVADILFDVDISLANLEAPVTEQTVAETEVVERGIPVLRFPSTQFSTVTGHRGENFTVLNFANNHTFDMGTEGIETAQRLLDQNGITDIGTPRNPNEYGRAKILTKCGIKIGLISATFSLNGRQPSATETYRVHTAKLMSKYVATDLELLKMQIEDCKNQGCDFIVASLHWGYEFEFFPRYRQVEAAHALIEAGVDLILGHHPHVIQPLEYYRTTRDPNRVAVIAYSLGGLGVWGYESVPHLVLGLVLNLKVCKGRVNGVSRTYIESMNPIPVFQSVYHQAGTRFKRIEKLQDHLNGKSNHSVHYLKQIGKYADLALGSSVG